MMKENKITKAMVLAEIRAMAETIDMVGEIPAEAVIEYCDTTLAQMEAKRVKAQERAAQKRAEGDALMAEVQAVLTGEWATAEDIVDAVAAEGVTKGKVVHRLGQLIKAGVAEKEPQKLEDGRKAMCYRAIEA